MSIRKMAVAGQFYPNSDEELKAMFTHYNSVLEKHVDMQSLLSYHTRAVIVPQLHL